MTNETFGGLLTRWLDHIEARGRACEKERDINMARSRRVRVCPW
jgi:hypothetical protein